MPTEEGYLLGSDGVKTNVSDWLRPSTALKVGNNINMTKRGIITSRYNGWSRQRQTTFNGGAAFLEFAEFQSAGGTTTMVFQVAGKVYSYDLATETEITADDTVNALSTTALPCMRMFAPFISANPFMVYCNGAQEPIKITGTTAGARSALQLNGATYLAGAGTSAPMAVKTYAKPTFCEVFGDRMVFAGFSGNTTRYDVLISNSGDPEACTQSTPLLATDGGVFQVNPKYGKITGLKAFKLANESQDEVLLVAQERGVSVIMGDDALTYKRKHLTGEYGIPSNRTWTQIQNDLFFLASDGIRSFSTLVSNANLLNATLTFDVQDIINRFSAISSLKGAHAVHVAKFQEIQFWFPVDGGTTNTVALVFNYNTDNPERTMVSPIIFTRDNTSVACSLYLNGVFYGGGYTGILQVHYGVNTVDGNSCNWQISPALMRPSDPECTANLEKLLFILEGDNQKFLVDTFYYQQMTSGATQKFAGMANKELSAPSASGTVLGSWILGTGAFPVDHIKKLSLEPKGEGHMHEMAIKGNTSDHVIDLLAIKYRLNVGARLA